MTEAWLHRRGKPTWHFTPNARYGGLCHTTRHGTVYRIVCTYPHVCFEVLRLCDTWWRSADRELRSYSIEFADGGVYTFPVRKR